jgi:hypothetical protein
MPAPKPLPSLESLREYLHYFPETGDFVWVKTTSFRVKQGAVAGTVATNNRQRNKSHQHLLIRFQGVKYLAHRLAWLFGHGEDPGEKLVDHINGDPLDNRLCNLRLVTTTENQWNVQQAQSLSRSGIRGVYQSKQSGKWISEISVNGKKRHLGVFPTAELAAAAYQEAATQRLSLIGAS